MMRHLILVLAILAAHAVGPRFGEAPVMNGQPNGVELLRYADGRPASLRVYRDGYKVGRHYSWWPNGVMRFDATYSKDAFEGEFRAWHDNGRPFQVLHYRDGREAGSQRAWTADGELYLNYEVRNGRRYGFVNARPCEPVEPGATQS